MRLQTGYIACCMGLALAACNTAPQPGSYQRVTLPAANTGPTMFEAGPAPPPSDRNGNANYDSSGTYIGGHGIGTMVDSPETSSSNFGVPKIDAPSMSNMHCAGSSIANAGVMNCSSN